MTLRQDENFAAGNFAGPLSFLLHLVQTAEIDPSDVPLVEIFAQYLARREDDSDPLDTGAEFIRSTALLIWLKSRSLLPTTQTEEAQPELDIPFSFFQHLLDYCHFKEAGTQLLQREQRQQEYRARAPTPFEDAPKSLGLDHLNLQALHELFEALLKRANPQMAPINEEPWKVAEQIHFLRRSVVLGKTSLEDIFRTIGDRQGMIVTFLALLEILKRGEMELLQQNGLLHLNKKNPTPDSHGR